MAASTTGATPTAGLSRQQIKKLVTKLDRKHVHQRQIEDKTISFIEGWFAISEANAIFGFDGWDRETLQSERMFEQTRSHETVCAYSARVRIRVHAGSREICRDGTGVGVATARSRSDAHEKALKTAETDATKRALATFGNRFGLSLYSKDGLMSGSSILDGTGRRLYILRGPSGEIIAAGVSAEAFCGGLRQLIEAVNTVTELSGLRDRNGGVLEVLQQELPKLVTSRGSHFARVLERLFAARVTELESASAKTMQALLAEPIVDGRTLPNGKVDKSQLAIPTEKRSRDKAHLQLVAAKPCLLCGDMPCHAHHVTFAQPRGLAVKVSDEFTVPLCPMHHNLLHLHGSEAAFWRQHGIDPLAAARQLWQETVGLNAR